jgi:type I restriction enzyme S subunit
MTQPLFSNCTLDDLADFRNGKFISPSRYSPSGKYPVFGSNGLINRTDDLLNAAPVVVIGRVGAFCGSIHAANEPSWVTDNAIVVEPKPDVDYRFLYYRLKSLDLNRTAIGSAQPLVTQSGLKIVKTVAPPLSEQRAIAGVLGALDDKIELNRRMNETLEAIAQAEFRRMKEQGGETKTVGEIAEINSWTLGKNDELDRIEYVEISEVSRGNIANLQIFERGKEPSRARRRLRHGDTVLSTVRPERGSYFLCLNPSPNLIASTGFAVVTPTKAPWSYVHAALTQPETFEQLGHLADGGAYPAIRPEVIEAWEIPWPDDAGKLEDFHRKCAPLYERAEHNRRESRTLAGLRDALLPKLLSGAVRVKAAMDEHGRTR